MISRKKIWLVLGILMVAGLVLAACGTTTEPTNTGVVEEPSQTVDEPAAPAEEPCDNPYLGSCKLDGKGIPPDFFSDEHVRKAFNYCFDWDIFISDALAGEGVQNYGPLIPGMLGYENDGPHYTFDADKCAEEFALAYDGELLEKGFRFQIAYNSGNLTRETVAAILQNNISDVSDNFQVEIVGLPWPAFLAGIRARAFPVYISGWAEDIHDPHNWAQPFMVGTYAARQALPEDMVAGFEELVSAGVAGSTNAERAAAYAELNQADYDNAIAIRLAVATGRSYQQKWVQGWFYNPIWPTDAHWYTISKSAGAPNPDTLVEATIGDTDTLDPAWNYESAGDAIMMNIYDALVTYAGPDATTYVPALASSWEISDDGTTYTFYIREGVTFHEGQTLTATDVAYTFQRGLLQGGGWSPQWLYTEAFFGTGVYDVAELVDESGALDDDPEGLQAADKDLLLAACESVTSAIVADDAAGTVTMQLSQPWGPFLSTLANSWGSVINKEWAIANGTWDGDCATWQDFYGITSETAPLREVTNGTGPYMLDRWEPGVETVLVANDNYWRTEEVGPAWEGGPVGPPAIKTIVVSSVDEWSTRRDMLVAGDADFAYVPRQNIDQLEDDIWMDCVYDIATSEFTCSEVNADGLFRLYRGYPTTVRTDAMFVFDAAH